jgi:hypothetical protein
MDDSLPSPTSSNHQAPNIIDDSNSVPANLSEEYLSDHGDRNQIASSSKTAEFHVNPNGNASTEASILFRYPPSVEPPPPEIVDFCLPLGGKLRRISHKSDDTTIQEILYGSGQSKRSGRCFIFTLDDKTTNDYIDEERGTAGGRLYGVCVIHSRLLEASVADRNVMDFESTVCFAFITRFPLFNFFFQVIFDIITTDRLNRMEELARREQHLAADTAGISVEADPILLAEDKRVYQYIPHELLNQVLESLSQVPAPLYGQSICFQASSGVLPINIMRSITILDCSEYAANASSWALPTLLSCLTPKLILWIISMILCEAKTIIIGSEPGLVSSTIFGLLALIRPLDWVAPIIPMLPYKHIDFVESPVPIIAGLMLDFSSTSLEEAAKIIERCK